MDFQKIDASIRAERGKGPSARLRREGKIPAVAYGPGHPTTAITVNPKDLMTAITGPLGRNAVIEVAVKGAEPFPTLLADYSYHPVSRDLTHADFLRIALDKPVDVEVPLATVGKAAGVVEGGVLRQIFRKLPISCLSSCIPVSIELDVTEMHQNDVRKVSDLNVPEGIVIRLAAEQTVAAVDAALAEETEAAPGTAEAAAASAEGDKKAPEKKAADKKSDKKSDKK